MLSAKSITAGVCQRVSHSLTRSDVPSVMSPTVELYVTVQKSISTDAQTMARAAAQPGWVMLSSNAGLDGESLPQLGEELTAQTGP